MLSADQSNDKKLNAGTKVFIPGIVKAVFGNIIHIKIGGKIIAVNTKDLHLNV